MPKLAYDCSPCFLEDVLVCLSRQSEHTQFYFSRGTCNFYNSTCTSRPEMEMFRCKAFWKLVTVCKHLTYAVTLKSISREFNGFFMSAFPRNYLLAESRSQSPSKPKVSWRNSFHRTRNSLPNWATWLDPTSVERDWQRWHNCHNTALQVHVQVEAFACKYTADYGPVFIVWFKWQ